MRIRLCLLLVFALALMGLAAAQNPAPQPEQQPQKELPAAPSSVKAPPPPPQAPAPQPAPSPEPVKDGDEEEDDDEEPMPEEPARDADPLPAVPVRRPAEAAPGDAAAQRDDQFTYRVGVDEVNLVFTVTDRRGRFVKDLTKEDIQVLDDEKPPLAIMNFTRETDMPLRVGLLVDSSNSVRDRFRFQQEAAIEFFHQVIRRGYDQAFVAGFDAGFEITQGFTDDVNDLSDGLRTLRPGGGTALYDAIYRACRDQLLSDDRAARRALVLLGDGDDNQSRVTREEAIDMALRAEVVIYAISTNISGNKTRGDRVMERLAEATGGRAFFPFKLRDVANALEDIQTELRSQYAVAYRPADFALDGRFRSVEILTENKRLNVRARKGYYAPRQ